MLRVQKQAVQQIDGKNVVFVATQHGDNVEFYPQEIDLGSLSTVQQSSDQQWVEVRKGLTANQSYASQGSFLRHMDTNPNSENKTANDDHLPVDGWFDRLIQFSINNAIWVMLFIVVWIVVGVWSYQKLPIDAVPDITNTQVQVNSQANGFTALEMEQRVTYPIETAMAGMP